MLRNGQVAVFDCFREEDTWDDYKPNQSDVLFTCILLKSVLKRSEVTDHGEVPPVKELEYCDTRISIGEGFRTLTLWKGTDDERTFLMMGEGKNSVRKLLNINGKIEEEYTPIPVEEYDKVAHLELTNLCDYPTFNERLYLCEHYRRNIDPLKELAFNKPLDKECRVYIDIIAGKVPIRELGY